MQSDIGSHSLSGGSQLSSTAPATAPAHPIDDVFEITQEDASILEEYIEEFKEGDADTRSRIIANVMAELYALRDGTVSFNKKDADRVNFLISNGGALKLMVHNRGLENGFTTAILHLNGNTLNSPANGPPEIPFTTYIEMKSCWKRSKCLELVLDHRLS